LRVIDISAPSAPVGVGYIDVRHANDVAVVAGYAYVVNDDSGLRVIDVSTPWVPRQAGSVDTPPARGVAASGGYAFVLGADGAGADLVVLNVSTPSTPVEVGIFSFGSEYTFPIDVATSGGSAYVVFDWQNETSSGSGLRVIDVRTPSAPVEVGFFDTSHWGHYVDERTGVVVADGYVYFAARDAGLFVFRECPAPAPDARECFIPAAAVAAGAQGAFFQTDVEINNTGTEEAQVSFQWLPRGEDNLEPATSEAFALAPGASLRFDNMLAELFGLGPDSLGALKLVASTSSVIGMSRTYNIPAGKAAGTFGQGLPAIRATEMIMGNEPQRILFLSERIVSRANVGCVNGTNENRQISIGLFDDQGSLLETRTMDLGPYSNNQFNHVFQAYFPVNGYVDVWADDLDALYYCYGSVLDNSTSDPTTILPQVSSADTTFIPAAALAAGLESAFFRTDIDLNNLGSTVLSYQLLWLPRGTDNSDPVRSDTYSLAAGFGVRYANVLSEVFGLEPDQVGALALEASGTGLLAMSRTYNLPSAKLAGTFGQGLPGIPADRMIPTGVKKRIIFMNENDDIRSNVGCQNAGLDPVTVKIELHNADGERLGTRTMELPSLSNGQMTRVFRNHAPISAGYLDVWTDTEGASIYCYGSVLDNVTSDPTTVLPQ
jgi:hypothetical protein